MIFLVPNIDLRFPNLFWQIRKILLTIYFNFPFLFKYTALYLQAKNKKNENVGMRMNGHFFSLTYTTNNCFTKK